MARTIGLKTTVELECLERADRLLREGVVGDRELIASMIYEATLAEREACAKVVEDHHANLWTQPSPWNGQNARAAVAAAIRKRTD